MNSKACSPLLKTCPDGPVTVPTVPTVPTTPALVTAAPQPSASCPGADLTPVAGQCKIFIRCIGTTMFQFSCPTGQLFNRTTKTCQSTLTACL